MKKIFENILKEEVALDHPYDKFSSSKLYLSFAMQRSGQHVVLDWFCRGLDEIIHLNHCRFYNRRGVSVLSPMTGRTTVYTQGNSHDSDKVGRFRNRKFLANYLEGKKDLIYTVEDFPHNSKYFNIIKEKFKPKTFLILRDPANWLASSIAHDKHSFAQLKINLENYKSYIRAALDEDVLSINYTNFIQDIEYRKALAEIFSINEFENAEKALHRTPDFGGGSSFSKGEDTDFLSRWKRYKDDARFIDLLNDAELIQLAKRYFTHLPGPFKD